MTTKKPPKPKPCRQRGVCKSWDTCPFHHDARECLQGETNSDEALPMEVS